MPNANSNFAVAAPAPGHSLESIRAMQMALVQLCIRTPKPISAVFARTLAKLPKADASDLARRLSNWLGRAQHCRSPACRRARACQGRPPGCWRDEPPPLAAEIALAVCSFERQMHEISQTWPAGSL